MTDILDLLKRDDKWFLEHPSFWDAARYLHFPVEPIAGIIWSRTNPL